MKEREVERNIVQENKSMKLEEIGKYLQRIQGGGKICVVTDRNVASLYLDACRESLEAAGYEVHEYILPPGETSKNAENYLKILDYLISVSMTRSDGIVALGGGMVGDIAGFVAATYMRGISVYQVPTTLLAAVDSSVGGKTAIDLPAGKNLVGAFHQPKLVLQDSSLLKTLPPEIYREGMAEVIKYGMINNIVLFSQLKDRKYTKKNLSEVIRTCVEMKKQYVDADEFDHGLRHMLNFGHTLGHAIEILSDYTVSHGDAVAKGMYWMTGFSVTQGWCSQETLNELEELLMVYGFDLELDYDRDEIYRILCSDKKRTGDQIRIVTPDEVGVCRIRTMNLEEVRNLL